MSCQNLLLLFALAPGACGTPPPSALDLEGQQAVVLVKTVRLPDDMEWYTRFAHHSWIELRMPGEGWQRVEIIDEVSPPQVRALAPDDVTADYRWEHSVQVLESIHGELARRAGARILTLTSACTEFGAEGRGYHAWPGPNSNSFVAWVIENTPELHAELDHNAVGKDDTAPFRLGLTSAGYGVEIDTPYLGAGLGLRQGAELRLLGLTFGISLWPPALKIPILPRLGFQPGVVGAAGAFVSPENTTRP